ncbi:MAG: START-like domain-containing protein [Bacteroidetes bacterium]|nr:START-like domain-containing protein [Bacteroidota bacterium]
MTKNQFVADYQLNASKKIIYTYLSTASGLQEWFADKVRIDEDKNYIFNFDQEDHYAKQTIVKANLHVRWDFFDPKTPMSTNESFIEFKLDEAELTQSLFLKVIDQSNFYTLDELEGIWKELISKLKGTIGG